MRCALLPILLSVAGCSLDYGAFDVLSAGGAGGTDGVGAGATGASGSTGAAGTGGRGAPGGDRAGAAGGAGASSVGGRGGGPPVGGSGAGGSPVCTTVTYTAVIADCVRLDAPNPDTCKSFLNPMEFIIDTDFSAAGGGWYEAYVRFDLDGAFAANDVTSVTLRMTASPAGSSDDTGDIFQVTAFDRADLFSTGTLPSTVGGLAGSQGTLPNNAVIDWPLPTTVAVPGQSVYLRVHPLSGDGARYVNTDGAAAPQLIVDCN